MQIASITGPKIEVLISIVMVKSTHKENQSQTKHKDFKLAGIFLTGDNGIIEVTSKKNEFFFISVFQGAEQNTICIPPGAYDWKVLKKRNSMNFSWRSLYYTRGLPSYNQTKFLNIGQCYRNSTWLRMTNRSRSGWYFTRPLGFKPILINEENNLSDISVEMLMFDNNSLEIDSAQGMIFEGKRSRIIHNFNMNVDPGHKQREKFRGGFEWYMTEIKDFDSNISFELKK